uniref:receptor protein-tyrosine kinase n=1 Tax=Scleropages formosus TaxID=113540 RepID=A0A8C9VQZ9_SCLFO
SHVSPSVSLGPRFVQSPANMTLSQGKPVKMQCMLQMDGSYELPPDVLWQKDIQALDFADTSQMQIPINEDTWMVISELRCSFCLPHFSEEPRDILVVANVSLSLRCVAHGPPEPVRVIWLQDGVPLNILQDPVSLSPSTLTLPGLNKTSTFSCEAHNRKGVATSGSGTVTVIPSQPQEVRAIQVSSSSLHIAWRASFGGVYPITECSIQVTACSEDLTELPATVIRHQSMNSAPSDHVISDLKPLTEYNVRVACSSTQGESPWTPWVTLHTSEGGRKKRLKVLSFCDELKQKLQDVMVDRHKLTLGKTLGEGEFGSVMEGLLTQEETVLRVAVKTMKIAICTRTEMEDFLREAACMKDFDHPNIMRLLGVCLQTVEGEGYPSPVVILPYMKHGDLHSYLLYSRLGDCPVFLPTQMLVKFMTDIARGMEYLSSKNFIHRDLAARNCMLNENMTVCVADFGLSKKIYNGDYYRQGRISKMPVKWIAIESLADRVYTSKSDVWSFGVTMWEIATRGQTPYPGVENSEIYDYLRQGNRLKQPPDCLDSIYALMFSCWLLSPKDRPGFEFLRCELEKTLEELPDLQDPDEILYVNMEEARPELGAVGGRDPLGVAPPFSLKGPDPVTASADVHQPGRYVLCPQHETQRFLTDSLESLTLPASSSLPMVHLEPSGSSTRAATPTPEELEEHGHTVRKVPWE